MNVKLCLNLSVEQIARLIYLEKGIPGNFKSDDKQLIKFLRRHKKGLIVIKRIPELRETHLNIELDELSPCDLSLIDKYKVQ